MTDFGPILYLVDHMMMPFLSFSYENIWANYGVAIILLTAVIKLIFLPLMSKQYESMKAMQVINPKVKKIREQYAKQPEKLQKELMGLYKSHNINPLKGCLPMVVQIPFFLAIYSTILGDSFKTMISQPGVNPGLFTFWLADLSLPDGTFILPVLLAGFTYWSQKMMMMDPAQKKFLMFSPLLILAFGIKLPAGVLLYWAVSTILSTVHQYWAIREPKAGSVEIIAPEKGAG